LQKELIWFVLKAFGWFFPTSKACLIYHILQVRLNLTYITSQQVFNSVF
jgi:hypothetical protein